MRFNILGTCVEGKSWNGDYEVCSGHGSCNELSGECVCNPSFDGKDCSRVRCPEVSGVGICNNRGICLSSDEYAKHFIKITQNDDPYNTPTFKKAPAESLDNTDIYGCLCDIGFGGYDCSESI